jgi:hypothetical protein
MSGLTLYGRFQKSSRVSTDFGIYGFQGGLNVKDLPEQVGPNDLTIALNGYLRPGGGFASRYGMELRNTLGSGPIQGIFRYYRAIVNGSSVPPTARTIVQSGTTLYWAELGTVIGTVASGSQPFTAVQIQNPNDKYYPNGLTDCAVICTGAGGPYVYDGVRLYVPAGWAAASGARWCAVVNGILWFGGIPGYPNQIFGTGTGEEDDGSMQSLPAERNFVYTSSVVGLCAVGTGATAVLAVGRTTGITVLSGTGSTNFYQQDLPMADGVTAGRTMVALPNGQLSWLGNQAVYITDTQSAPQPLSYKVEPYILNDLIIGGYPISARSSCFSWVYNNRLHLGYYSGGAYPGYGAVPPANTILVYDLMLGGWTVLQTTPGISCATLMNAPSDPSPWVCLVGSSSSANVYTWDVEPVLGQTATDNGTPFTVTMQTKYFKLGEPGTVKALRRQYPEFFACGTLNVNVTAATDYGTSITNNEVLYPFASTVAQWDVSKWDEAVWAPSASFAPIVAPQTRVDYDGVAGDSFAFGVTTSVANPPWMYGGVTGVFHQRGRV